MCGGFGSLVEQGFLTPFTGREYGSQVKGADSKKRHSHFFDTLQEGRVKTRPSYSIPWTKYASVIFQKIDKVLQTMINAHCFHLDSILSMNSQF